MGGRTFKYSVEIGTAYSTSDKQSMNGRAKEIFVSDGANAQVASIDQTADIEHKMSPFWSVGVGMDRPRIHT